MCPRSSAFQTVTALKGKKDGGWGNEAEGQTQIYKRKFSSVTNQNVLHNTPHTSEVFLKMGVSVTWKLLFPVMSLSYKTVDNPEPAGVGLLQR